MSTKSPRENPYKVISDTFESVFDLDSENPATIAVLGSSVFMAGTHEDGSMVSISKASIHLTDFQGVFRVHDVTAIADDKIPDNLDEYTEEAEMVAEYYVGGSEEFPFVHELITHEPFFTRRLDQAEMAELAKKIGSTTFY